MTTVLYEPHKNKIIDYFLTNIAENYNTADNRRYLLNNSNVQYGEMVKQFQDWLMIEGATLLQQNKKLHLVFFSDEAATMFLLRFS